MLPTRTQKYIDAMVEQGDKFDHSSWLQRVRQEEAAANPNTAVVLADKNPNKGAAPKYGRKQLFAAASKAVVSCRVRRSVPAFQTPARRPTRKSALTGRIESVKAAWSEMKRKNSRHAIFGYLEAVFELVMLYSQRRQTERLVGRALKREGFPVEKMDPFLAIIRCTADSNIDRKTVSRWSRALRFVVKRKDRGSSLKAFMEREGGVNACAAKFARILGRAGR